jgi:hypothetical protein
VKLAGDTLIDFDGLNEVIAAKAPMLGVPVVVIQNGKTITIPPGWWKTASQEEFVHFLKYQGVSAVKPTRNWTQEEKKYDHDWLISFKNYAGYREVHSAPRGGWPEAIGDSFRILAVASEKGHVIVCSGGFAIDTVQMPGLFGLAEIGDVELDASRSHVLTWDHETFRNQLLGELRPRIVQAMDGLASELSVHLRQGFLRSIGAVYGEGILLDTKLPWISVMQPPGSLELLNPQEFSQRVRGHEVFAVFGEEGSPWNCARFCKACYPGISDTALIIPVNTVGQPDPGSYRDEEDEFIEGSLPDHFYRENFPDKDDRYKEATLLIAMIQLIADVTGRTVENVVEMPWIRNERTICLRLPAVTS